MHVQKLMLCNFKTIENFDADFVNGVYLVTGENEIGKSTLINAIGMLLTGERSNNLLRNGEEKGYAKMLVGEGDNQYEVSLSFTEKNPRGTMSIQKVGTALKSNQISALQDIFKYQDFDANEFVKWSETAEGRRKQVAIVKSLLPQAAQDKIAEIDGEVARIKEERKTVNADIKTYEGLVAKPGITEKDKTTYAKEENIQSIIDEKVKAAETNEKRKGVVERQNRRKADLEAWEENSKADTDAMDLEIEEAQKKLDALKLKKETYVNDRAAAKKEAEQAKADADKWLQENPEQDLEALQLKITNIEEHNQKHAKVKALEANEKKLASLIKKKDKQEAEIDKLLANRAETIKLAALPIEGLDFDDDGLTLNGVPFKTGEISTSQEMEVAAKLIIAKNPTVKVFRIAQGESLGTKRLKAIVDFATKAGYQGFIEEVHRGQDELIIHEYEEKA